MSPKMLEEAFEGANQLYAAGDITKDEYLNILRGFDTEKIIASSAEEATKKQELNALINNAITVVSMAA